MQRRKHSLAEAALNTASGFCISYITGLIVFPAFGFHVSAAQNSWIVGIFTVISVARNYVWRRTFNWMQHHAQH